MTMTHDDKVNRLVGILMKLFPTYATTMESWKEKSEFLLPETEPHVCEICGDGFMCGKCENSLLESNVKLAQFEQRTAEIQRDMTVDVLRDVTKFCCPIRTGYNAVGVRESIKREWPELEDRIKVILGEA